MESDLPKVLHRVAGRPILSYVIETAKQLQPSNFVTVVGYQAELVQKIFPESTISWVIQEELNGTGGAIRCTKTHFEDFDGPILVLYGDIPGIKIETLRRLRMIHDSGSHTITILTADLEDPTGYGRVVVAADGTVSRIVEHRDATPQQREITEINTGIGIYEPDFLFEAVETLKATNKQKEFYLTDLIEKARSLGKSVGKMECRDPYEVQGINTRSQLADVARYFFDQKASMLLDQGVTMEDPASVTLEPDVDIQKDVEIEGIVGIRGNSRVGSKSTLKNGVNLVDTQVGEGCTLEEQVSISDSVLGDHVTVGKNSVIQGEKN